MPDKEKKSSYTGQTEARRRATAKYLKETVEDIRIRVPKGQKAIIKSHADNQGESLNSFVIRAIDEAMERDSSQANPKQITGKSQASTESEKPTPSAPAASIPKDTSKVDLSRLINDIAYQITVQEAFGKSVLSELLDKARKQQED